MLFNTSVDKHHTAEKFQGVPHFPMQTSGRFPRSFHELHIVNVEWVNMQILKHHYQWIPLHLDVSVQDL